MLTRERAALLIASAGGALILACTNQPGNSVNNELVQSLISKPALNDCELAKFSRSLSVKEREIGISRTIRQLFNLLFTPSFLDEFKIDELITKNPNLEYFISDAVKTIGQRSLDCVATIPSESIAQPRIEFSLVGEPPFRIDSLVRVDLRRSNSRV